MKTASIIIGVVFLIIIVAFLYLLISGADGSRRIERNKDRQEKDK